LLRWLSAKLGDAVAATTSPSANVADFTTMVASLRISLPDLASNVA
jgi:hypothetical protein